MDIDFFWAFGGWFLVQNCMATTLKINSSSSPILEISTKSHQFLLLFFSLLFIILAVVNSSADFPSKPSSDMAPTLPNLEPPFSAQKTGARTMDFHPRKRERFHASKSKGKEFEAGDHEVPSGPNPISNR